MDGKLFFLLVLTFFNLRISESVDVSIYYETYNENVRKFITEQFGPLVERYDGFNGKLKLNVYPFGRATIDDAGKVTCNIPEQCEANLIHGCAMYKSGTRDNIEKYDPKDVSAFVRCFFKNRFAFNENNVLSEDCLIRNKIEYKDMVACTTNSDAVTEINKAMAKATDKVKEEIQTSGLIIRIGDETNGNAQIDLLDEVCKAGNDVSEEDGCKGIKKLEKVKLSVFYEAKDITTARFFNKQLSSYYHVLEDFVDIDLVPYGNMNFDTEKYECPKDQTETTCVSNVFQAMVINRYMGTEFDGDLVSGANRAVNFVSCLFHQDASTNVYKSLEVCSDENLDQDEYPDMLMAYRTKEDLFKKAVDAMKKKTDGVKVDGKLPSVPYITLNTEGSIDALNDLIQTTCAKYQGSQKSSICERVQVAVLYEPLNHKTRTMFIEEIKPLFDNLQNLVDFKFIPAGTAEFPDARNIQCKSPETCEALKFHSCVYNQFWLTGEDYISEIRQDAFDIIQCMFKNKAMLGVEQNTEVCTEMIDGWFNVETCYKTEGNNILVENIKETMQLIDAVEGGVNPEFPALIFNEKTLIKTVPDLITKICESYDEIHRPNFCLKAPPKKIPITVFYQSDSELSKYFFTTQYDPWYLNIEEMVDVKLIPGGDSNDPEAGDCDKIYDPDSSCFANMIQAFVIGNYNENPNMNDWLDGNMRTMHFMRCFFSHPKWKIDYKEASIECESELGLDEIELIPNVIADEGKYYKKALEDTAKFFQDIDKGAFGLLPYITIGDKKEHSKRAADDLLQTVCALWEGDKPRECTPVTVEVYYSGFHPQSRRFFVNELIPVFRNLRERIQLDLIPFGTLKDEDVDCNSYACNVNIYQACAIEQYFIDEVQEGPVEWDGKNQTLSYIHCMFKTIKDFDIPKLSEECASKFIIEKDTIRDCARGEDGKAYLEKMKQKTKALGEEMDVAPWIVINGKRIPAAESDLRKAICAEIVGDVPDYCAGERAAKVALQVHYSTLDDDSQKYILTELYENYRDLEEIIDLDLVSLGECSPLNIPGNEVVQCPGHADEAHAALFHACVNDMFWRNDDGPITENDRDNVYDGKIQVVEFLECYFKSENYPEKPSNAATACAEQVFGDIFSTLEECVKDGTGFGILKRYQDEKVQYLKPSLKYTPWITVNNVHNYAVENHIRRTVCDAYQGADKPAKCNEPVDPPEKPSVQIHYEIDDPKSVSFFTKYFDAEKVNEIAFAEFIPFGRSKKDGDKFTCKNDPECHKYRQHLCLIDAFYSTYPIPTMKTIKCTFEAEYINNKNAVNDCFNREFTDQPFDKIQTCQIDTEATDKLLNSASESATGLGKAISHSPWVVINGEHNLEAEFDLPDELCSEYYPSDKPKECQVDLLPVEIYYQTRDKDVSKFFSEQLDEQTDYLTEIGNFDFVPYGKTKMNGNDFTCSSEDQCHANIIHACAIDHVDKTVGDKTLNKIRLARFFVCTFAPIQTYVEHLQSRNTSIEEKCAGSAFENEDIWREIISCAKDPDNANDLMKKMKEKTDAAKIGDTLPEIVIKTEKNTLSRTAFFQVLCNSYDIIRPPLCRTMKDFGVPTGIYFSGDKASQDYFNSQIKPLYESVAPAIGQMDENPDEQSYRLISPELIPWGTTEYNEEKFTCTGENECFINRFFACAISAHGKEPRAQLHLMEFAVCFFSNAEALTKPSNVLASCTSAVWTPDPFIELKICAESTEPADYKKLLVMKDLTEQVYPELKSFPSITIRNNYNEDATKGKLFTVLCSQYEGIDKPASCSDSGDKDPGSSALSLFASSIIIFIASLLSFVLF